MSNALNIKGGLNTRAQFIRVEEAAKKTNGSERGHLLWQTTNLRYMGYCNVAALLRQSNKFTFGHSQTRDGPCKNHIVAKLSCLVLPEYFQPV